MGLNSPLQEIELNDDQNEGSEEDIGSEIEGTKYTESAEEAEPVEEVSVQIKSVSDGQNSHRQRPVLQLSPSLFGP